ncbi:MAG TPA: MBL fold metallo-hydrolase [Candidatus Thermoplasmatota archaeon]|nr:MBL fold metallo-hydrolase [Candidatus Thermoplasmatota archaeon]
MDLTVIGASSRYLAPLGAGSSYLVTDGETRILADCGNGTSIRLGHELGDKALSAVVVSHFHLDTVADLFPVAKALPLSTPIFVPDGARPKLQQLMRAYGIDRPTRERTLIEGVARNSVKDVGSVRLTFERSAHGCPGVAVRFAACDGTTLVYLSDTGPRPWLVDFARGADLLVAHTLHLDRDGGRATRHNLTAGAAGRLARDAGVPRLALSHIPFYANAEESHAEAKAAFGGEVVVLREGQRLPVRAV